MHIFLQKAITYHYWYILVLLRLNNCYSRKKRWQICYKPGNLSGTTVQDTFRAGDDLVIVSPLNSQSTTSSVSIFVTFKLSYSKNYLFRPLLSIIRYPLQFGFGWAPIWWANIYFVECIINEKKLNRIDSSRRNIFCRVDATAVVSWLNKGGLLLTVHNYWRSYQNRRKEL